MNDITKAKIITAEQAATTLAACSAPKADSLFVDDRPDKLKVEVGKGATAKEIATRVGVPVNVASCAAQAYGLEDPSMAQRASAWAGGLVNSFKNAASEVATKAEAKYDAALQAAQPATAPGVTQRGATLDQFCATVEANGGSARDQNIAAQRCEGGKAKAPGM